MAADPSDAVVIEPDHSSVEAHRQGVIGALAKRLISQMYFKNILAILMVFTMCYKELMGLVISDQFYLLVGMVIGMYFKSDGEG